MCWWGLRTACSPFKCNRGNPPRVSWTVLSWYDKTARKNLPSRRLWGRDYHDNPMEVSHRSLEQCRPYHKYCFTDMSVKDGGAKPAAAAATSKSRKDCIGRAPAISMSCSPAELLVRILATWDRGQSCKHVRQSQPDYTPKQLPRHSTFPKDRLCKFRAMLNAISL